MSDSNELEYELIGAVAYYGRSCQCGKHSRQALPFSNADRNAKAHVRKAQREAVAQPEVQAEGGPGA